MFSTDESAQVPEFKKQLAFRDAKVTVLEEFYLNLHQIQATMTCSHKALNSELDSTSASISRAEGVIRTLDDRGLMGYWSLMLA